MKHSLEVAVRNRLAGFLTGESTLDDLKTWLVAMSWSLERPLATPEARIINQIKLALAEHSGGFASDEELRETLIAILNGIGMTAELVG